MKIAFVPIVLPVLGLLLAACSTPGGAVRDLNNSHWQVIEINGQAVPDSMDVTADFADGKITGQAPCNRYFADYSQDGAKLTFSMAGMTLMYCTEPGVMDIEAAFSQALAAVGYLEEVGDRIHLLNENNEAVLVLGAPRSAALLDKTSWQLTDLTGQVLRLGVQITLDFSDGRISGKAACNTYHASYTQDGHSLNLGAAATTRMYCQGLMEYETAYLAALAQVRSFNLRGGVLSLLDEGGTPILFFSAPQPAPSLADTSWKVITIAGKQVPAGLEVTLSFRDGSIGGKAACNNYFASYTQAGSQLTFSQAGATRMFCNGAGIMDTELAFLQSLDKVRSFQFEKGYLVLLDDAGQALLALTP